MGTLLKLQLVPIFVGLLAILALPFLPVNFKFEPIAYNVPTPKAVGPLTSNKLLDPAKPMFQRKLNAPESLAVKDGFIFTGTRFGDIFKIDPVNETITKVANTGKQCVGERNEERCGRVLGLRFGPDGELYAADAFKGLLKIYVESGAIETLVPHGSYVGSSRLMFADDLDIDEDGVIYFSQASLRWGLHQIAYIILEHDLTGRILAYDTKSKKSWVLIEGLAFPNGVQLSHDRKALLFSELGKQRVMRYDLKGDEKGKLSVFSDMLPGGPDNIRASPRGTYWIALDVLRSPNAAWRPLMDVIAPYPLVATLIARLSFLLGRAFKTFHAYVHLPVLLDLADKFENGKYMLFFIPSRSAVLEIDQEGKILRSLQSWQFTLFSEVLELKDYLYLGSFIQPYLLRLEYSA